jgi:hypothetical protein
VFRVHRISAPSFEVDLNYVSAFFGDRKRCDCPDSDSRSGNRHQCIKNPHQEDGVVSGHRRDLHRNLLHSADIGGHVTLSIAQYWLSAVQFDMVSQRGEVVWESLSEA